MNLAQHYAHLLAGGIDVEKALNHMKAKGHLSLLPQIVRMLGRTKKDTDTVVVAREADVPKAKKAFPGAVISIDPQIVGGYFAKKHSTLIDATYRKALVDIYKNAVN